MVREQKKILTVEFCLITFFYFFHGRNEFKGPVMDTLKLTGQNLARVFNSRLGHAFIIRPCNCIRNRTT